MYLTALFQVTVVVGVSRKPEESKLIRSGRHWTALNVILYVLGIYDLCTLEYIGITYPPSTTRNRNRILNKSNLCETEDIVKNL